MSMEPEPYVIERAEEIEQAIKDYLTQEGKETTSRFKVKYLTLTHSLNGYTDAINYLDRQGIIENTGVGTQSTSWIYNGPEGTDRL